MPVTVCIDTDPCEQVATIADALARPGTRFVITVPDGVYLESGTLSVTAGRDVTIVAAAKAAVSLTTSGFGPVFEVTDASLHLVDISAAKVGNRVFTTTDATLEVTRGVFYSLGLVADGGVLAAEGGAVTLDGARLLTSLSAGDGGLVWVSSSRFEATDTTFRGGFGRRGGAVWIDDGTSPVSFTDCTFEDNEATDAGGAIGTAAQGPLVITGSRFVGNRAQDGAAVAALPWLLAHSVDVTDTAFEDNRAEGLGGALFLEERDGVVRRSSFFRNHAAEGGAVFSSGSLAVGEDLFCANVASGAGGAVHVTAAQGEDWTHARFVDNEAREGGAVEVASGARVSLRFASLLGNRAAQGAALHANAPVVSGAVAATAALVVGSRGDVAVRLESVDAAVGLERMLFWDNPQGNVVGPVLGDPLTVADPLLRDWVPGMPCEELSDGYSPYSPLVDGGPVDVFDPDGTGSDVGAWGGFGAGVDPVPEPWQDADGDGVPSLYDCEPDDALVYPPIGGLEDPEQWYDGIDQNCDGRSDEDRDQDGWDRDLDCPDDDDPLQNPGADDAPGVDLNCDGFVDGDGDGFEPPADCDDADADVYPGAPEDEDLTVDADCDGFVEPPGTLAPRRCDTGTGRGGAVAALVGVAAMLGRRRDRSRDRSGRL
jgi:hypothetical protein